jgi:hypothetical protein
MDAPKAPSAYQFVMDKWTPATIPMKRLAQYLEKLSALLGSTERVHFAKITKGSARPEFDVEEIAAFEVEQRLQAAADGSALDAVKLRKEINRLLQEDNCTGYLRVCNGPKILDFPGRKTPLSQEMIVHEAGELEGTVIRVGGKDASVPVHLVDEEGTYYRCQTSRDIAKQLAQKLFDGTIRVAGKGKWRRNAEGVWALEDFTITSFEKLNDGDLQSFVRDMRAIEGSAWNDLEDPQAELKRIRGN